jgi:hypothetical protein
MSVFEQAFGVPAGHTLREVRCSRQARGSRHGIREWEHEERDGRGMLVAVYESWARASGTDGAGAVAGWVKYSPHGWVLRRAGAPAVGALVSAAAACPEAG